MYETILNSLEESVLLFNRKGRLVFLNKSAEELFGRSQRDLKDKSLNALLEDSKEVASLMMKTIQEGRSFKVRDAEFPDLREERIDIAITPFYDNLTEDLEHRRQSERSSAKGGGEAREAKGAVVSIKANRSLADPEDYNFESMLYLLGSIAHEIKNPLSGIKGAAQILSARSEDRQDEECLRMILKETDRLNAVLQGYLTMTRRPVLNRLNIHEVLEHALKVLLPLFKGRGIRIEKSYDPSLPDISGDEAKLLQVFINLFKNAIEALDGRSRGRELFVSSRLSNEYVLIYEAGGSSRRESTRKKQRWIIISIRDNGPGIDQEEQRKIFLPFYTKKKEGSGLGLSLSKKIIKDHGGIIKVKSQKGEGTVFNVYLPLKVAV